MLEKLYTDYNNWLKIGEIMSKRPISYFASESAKGEYSGWLRTKAYYEIKLAQLMDLENEDGVYSVDVEKFSKENYI